jgi:cysteine desulfurase
MNNKNKVYLDYAASTPVDPIVLKEMSPYFCQKFANPGSLHFSGQIASQAVFQSRQKIAQSLGVNYNEIIFTGSATEANNLALRGVVSHAKSKIQSASWRTKIIISSIEHESVLETAQILEKWGVNVVRLPVNSQGIVDLKVLEKELDNKTVLVSVMTANNQMGALQPIKKIANLIKEFRISTNSKDFPLTSPTSPYPFFHTDAVQAFQYLNCTPEELGVDLMTLSGQKIYGPKGIGLLYIKKQSQPFIQAQITGGSQEQNFRSGTENVPAIVGFSKAIELTDKLRQKEFARLKILKEYFYSKIKKNFPKARLNGSLANSLPNNLNIYFPGISGEKILIALDLAGIAISSGSACSARSISPSYVLLAMGLNNETAKNSLRFSFGRQTTKTEINKTISALKNVFQ